MKNTILILILGIITIFSNLLFAATEDIVFIEGKIGTVFDKSEVQIVDEYNQKFFLNRNLFPQNFKFEAGLPFRLEVPDDVLNNVILIK